MSTTTAHETAAGETGSHQLWKCSDRLCSTEQTFLDRNKAGRKVTSDFFGRNKTATKAIDDDVWHWQCRKGYQVGKYRGDTGTVQEHKNFYYNHLRHQLVRIGLWRPESTFTIQLSKPAKERLNNYHSVLRRNGNDVNDAVQQVAVAPKTGKGNKAVAPALASAVKPDHAEYIDSTFAGENKTISYIIDTILLWIDQEFNNGNMTRMPPIEFLINDPQPGETITDPTTNYDRWIADVDGSPYESPTNEATKASSSKKRKADSDVETSSPSPAQPSKRPKLILKHSTPPPAASSSSKKKSISPGISPKTIPTKRPSFKIKLFASKQQQQQQRPPIILKISKPRAQTPPTAGPSNTQSRTELSEMQKAALALFRIGADSPPVPSRSTSPDKLPLYTPPAPIMKAVAVAFARPALTIDTIKAAGFKSAAMVEYGSDEDESEEDDDEDDEELATPIFAGKTRMVYAAGKPRKRSKA